MNIQFIEDGMDDRWSADTIIGTYLSTELLPVPVPQWRTWLFNPVKHSREWMRRPVMQSREEQTRLRQVAHHEASIRCLKHISGGIQGVVVLAVIGNKKYVLKVVSRSGDCYISIVD